VPSRPSAERVSELVARLRAAGCVFAEEEAELLLAEATGPEHVETLVTRRAAGEPLEVVVGWAAFCGLRVGVDPGVFVPRRRTEFLVELGLRELASGPGGSGGRPVVVDLCCGTGAVGLAVATAWPAPPGVELHAADVDPVAVRCAARNLAGTGGHVHRGDLYAALPGELAGRVDLLLVNAPYVPTGEIAFMPPEARDHEPHHALDGGPDGVEVHRAVAAEAGRWLRPGGRLLIETGGHQAPLTAAALRDAGLDPRVETSPELEATVVIGGRPPVAGGTA